MLSDPPHLTTRRGGVSILLPDGATADRRLAPCAPQVVSRRSRSMRWVEDEPSAERLWVTWGSVRPMALTRQHPEDWTELSA
jgi:hypothetical protein